MALLSTFAFFKEGIQSGFGLSSSTQGGPGGQSSIGIIIGSTRPNCNGRTIALWIEKLIQQDNSLRCKYKVIDLAEWNLPLFNEPGIPMLYSASLSHSKAWSCEVKSLDGFLFVTPQYNWGYPASLKNALDYLYHEWTGKPAGIISYGGHGGGKAATQLQQVLQGLSMNVIPPVSKIILTPDMAVGGLSMKQAETSFTDAVPAILNVVRQIEERLCRGRKGS